MAANEFVKIYGSKLVSSSLWEATPEARLVFISMLALADWDGWVDTPSERTLARMLNLDVDYVHRALVVLAAPDPDSRSADNDGRRVIATRNANGDAGFQCVNYEKYREHRTKHQEAHRLRVQKYRARLEEARARDDIHDAMNAGRLAVRGDKP
jgi:hypothetical protein